MKDLETYIKEIKAYKLPNVLGYRTFEEFMCLNGLTEDNLTEQDIEAFIDLNSNGELERHGSSYINTMYETLISHKPEQTIKKLKSTFDNKVYDFRYVNDKSFSFKINEEDYKDVITSKQFNDIIKFYNYVKIRDIHYKLSKTYRITLEPNVTHDMTDYVYDECDGIVYHITPVQYKDSILNTGLRTKVTKKYKIPKDFIEFHKRIYYIAVPNKRNTDDILYEAKDMFTEENEELCVIKVDLHKLDEIYLEHKVHFYKDVRNIFEYTLYGFTYIPKECLSLYKEKL